MHNNFILNNGVSIPLMGFGTWKIADGQPIINATHAAIESGYRLFDTATLYNNEIGLGQALRSSRIDRSDYFVTNKVWNSDQGYEKTLKAFDLSLKNMGLDYLDAYLIHWPMPRDNNFIETWKALETIYKSQKVRVIGVANFHINHLEQLIKCAEIIPMINQVECHLGLQQQPLLDYCTHNHILMQAWRPLANASKALIDHDIVQLIAATHYKTPIQIMLAYQVCRHIGVIPKSAHPDRMIENADIFDIKLSSEEMNLLKSLDEFINRLGVDPDVFNDTVYVPRH